MDDIKRDIFGDLQPGGPAPDDVKRALFGDLMEMRAAAPKPMARPAPSPMTIDDRRAMYERQFAQEPFHRQALISVGAGVEDAGRLLGLIDDAGDTEASASVNQPLRIAGAAVPLIVGARGGGGTLAMAMGPARTARMLKGAANTARWAGNRTVDAAKSQFGQTVLAGGVLGGAYATLKDLVK
ncbi:MAG: hypothetical protein RJA99_3151 [Pseudomonadota bacterium]|jgi:hypothetical protein